MQSSGADRAFIEAPVQLLESKCAHSLSRGQTEADTGQKSQWAKWK